MIMIMIEIQGKGTACKPDRYIIRSNKINYLQKYVLKHWNSNTDSGLITVMALMTM